MANINKVKAAVVFVTGVSAEDINSRKRMSEAAEARALFAWSCRLFTAASLTVIGRAEGGRSHASVLHQVQRIDDLLTVGDKRTCRLVKEIETVMSKEKRTIEITPENGSDNGMERISMQGFDCPYCAGRGWHIQYEGKEEKQVDCPRCKGTGLLTAFVSVKWMAGG